MSEGQGGEGGEGGGGDFLASLPAELQSEGALKGFAGPDGHIKMAKSHVELNRTFNSRTMADMNPPQDDAGRAAVLAKLGHVPPDSPNGYNLPDKPSAKEFRDLAHRHGLTVKQAETMFGDIDSANAKSAEERKIRAEARKTESENLLRNEWGKDYDANMELVKKGTEHFFGEDMRSLLEATDLHHHPDMRKLLYGVRSQMSQAQLHQ